MNRDAQEIIDTIIEDFALRDSGREEMEAKAIFRLLNFCRPAAEPPAVGRTDTH